MPIGSVRAVCGLSHVLVRASLSRLGDGVCGERRVRRCKCNSRRGLVVSSPGDISPLLCVKLSLSWLVSHLRLASQKRVEADVFSSPRGRRCRPLFLSTLRTRLFFFPPLFPRFLFPPSFFPFHSRSFFPLFFFCTRCSRSGRESRL